MKTYDEVIRPRTGHGKGKEGAILGVVMMVLLGMSILGVGLVNLGTVDAVETVRSGQRQQAFWLAESGLHNVMNLLVTDSFFR